MNKYRCDKKEKSNIYGYIKPSNIEGFNIKPKNNIEYEGIEVSKLTLLKPTLIEIVLKRKTKRKLDAYLNFLINVTDDEEGTDPSDLTLVLDDIKRYKEIIINKYAKFLDASYIKKIILKSQFIEEELKARIMLYNRSYTSTKNRGR